MRKGVNGKIVKIDNIEFFERAITDSLLTEGVIGDSGIEVEKEEWERLAEYVRHYNIIYKAIPYPLYLTESDVKYAAIAKFIKRCVGEGTDIWVDNALYISLGLNKAIKFKGESWGIVSASKGNKRDADIERFKHEIGYKEFEWFISKIENGDYTRSYYDEFMGEFVEACNGDDEIMRRELAKILEFSTPPKRILLKDNAILDIDNGVEYYLDIYFHKLKPTGEKQYVLSVFDDSPDFKTQPVYVKTYGYDLYKKDVKNDGRLEKCKREDLVGVYNLFEAICARKIAYEDEDFEDFRAILSDGELVYEVDNVVYKCRSYRTKKATEIARGMSIYSYRVGMVYLMETTHIGKGIYKERIYSNGMNNTDLRLCKVQFRDSQGRQIIIGQ